MALTAYAIPGFAFNNGALSATLPNADPGSAYSLTTGSALTANNAGGSYAIVLGSGAGTGSTGQVTITATSTNANAEYEAALNITQTLTAGQNFLGNRQGIAVLLNNNLTGAQIDSRPTEGLSSVEFRHVYLGTGSPATLLYGTEFQFINNGPGTVQNATACQADLTILSASAGGTITSGSAFHASIGPFYSTAGVGSIQGFYVNTSWVSGTPYPMNAFTGFYDTVVYNTATGTSTTGGYSNTGAALPIPSQGGNTSLTNTNIGLIISGAGGGIPNAGGGNSAAGGTVNNYGAQIAVASGSNAAGGTVNNYGLAISGNGAGANANINYPFYVHSSAWSFFDGGGGIQFASGTGIGIGHTPTTSNDFIIGSTTLLTANPISVQLTPTFPATATGSGEVLRARFNSANSIFTMTNGYGIRVFAPGTGAASTVTELDGINIQNQGTAQVGTATGLTVAVQSGATNNTAICIGAVAAGQWGLYSNTTNASAFNGTLSVGTLTAPASGSGLFLGASAVNAAIWNASQGSGTTTTYIGNQSITTSSDIRLKANVVDTERDAFGILNRLRVVDHTWNDPTDITNAKNRRGTYTSLIAQEAIDYVPWIVNKPGNPDNSWFIQYDLLVPLMVKGMQDTDRRLTALEARLT